MDLTKKRRRRVWSDAERGRIAGVVRRRLKAGEPMTEISRDLDILSGTLRLWLRQNPTAEILPVRVEPASLPRATAGILIRLPSGIEISGLDVGDVAALLEELR